MARFCDKCGAEIKGGNVKFCRECGAEVLVKNNVETNASGAVVVCPHCGQPTPMGQPVCAKCGVSLENNTLAIVVGYIVTLIVPILGLIPGIYLVTRDNEKSKLQGVIIIALSVMAIISGLFFGFGIRILVYIVFIVIGILLWYKK